MSRSSEWRPRLNVDITPIQDAALKKYLRHGLRTILFGFLIDDLIDMLQENPDFVIAAIVRRDLKTRNILDLEN